MKRLRGWKTLIVAAVVLSTLPLVAQPGETEAERVAAWARADSSLATPAGPHGRVNALVWLESDADRATLRSFAAIKGGHIRYEYKVVLPNVINMRNLTMDDIEKLEKLPGVVRVEPDQFHENILNLYESTPLIRGLQSQVQASGHATDGSGVRICVVDTGIDSDHVMYSDRIDASAGYDFVNDDSDPEDDSGHGSHVAGIALGGTGITVDSCGFPRPLQGVAPGATLVGIKVLDWGASGIDSVIIAGIDHCADQSPTGGRGDVLNLSLGAGPFEGSCDNHVLAEAANDAFNAGLVVVASAGNNGTGNEYNGQPMDLGLSSPACGTDVIAVGATYKYGYPNCEYPAVAQISWLPTNNPINCTDINIDAGDLACFSNKSEELDVVAPGTGIVSASILMGGASFTDKDGTSMAAPHVAGLAALILDMDPSLTPVEVRQLIVAGATDMGDYGFDTSYGHGLIDVLHTLARVECGNGVLDPGEECDGDAFGGATCQTLGCGGGGLTCTDCRFDYSCCSECPGLPGGTCACLADADCNFGPDCSNQQVCWLGYCQPGTPVCDSIVCRPPCNGSLDCTTTQDLGVQCCDDNGQTLECDEGDTVHEEQCPCEGFGLCASTAVGHYCDQ